MSKKSHFTTVTALPAGISRETVLETLHNVSVFGAHISPFEF